MMIIAMCSHAPFWIRALMMGLASYILVSEVIRNTKKEEGHG